MVYNSREGFTFNCCPDIHGVQMNYRYPRIVQMIFAYVPFIMRWYRNFLMARVCACFRTSVWCSVYSTLVRYRLFTLPEE